MADDAQAIAAAVVIIPVLIQRLLLLLIQRLLLVLIQRLLLPEIHLSY